MLVDGFCSITSCHPLGSKQILLNSCPAIVACRLWNAAASAISRYAAPDPQLHLIVSSTVTFNVDESAFDRRVRHVGCGIVPDPHGLESRVPASRSPPGNFQSSPYVHINNSSSTIKGTSAKDESSRKTTRNTIAADIPTRQWERVS